MRSQILSTALLTLSHFAAPSAVAAPPPAALDPLVTKFLKAYCIDCHGPTKQKGDFRVDELKLSSNAADAENWQLVLDNLQLGEMPPAKAKQPAPREVAPVTQWIQAELKRASAELAGEKGEVVLRRLNRLEYQNTIADLFDVRGDYAVGFPEDGVSGGFDNNGAALALSAEQMAQYMKAADFILNRAIVTKGRPETKQVRFTLEDIEEQNRKRAADAAARKKKDAGYTPTKQEIERRKREEATGNFGSPYYPRYGSDDLIPTQYLKPDTSRFFNVREPGWYRYQVVAYAVRNEGQTMRLRVTSGSGKQEEVPTLVDVAQLTSAEPRKLEYRVYLQPGHRVELTMLDGTKWLPGSKIAGDTSPAIAIRSIEMEGPLVEEWPPRGHRVLFGDIDAAKLTDTDVPDLLRRLAPKLFRRPVTDDVVKEFAAFYQARRSDLPPLEAYKLTVKAMMVSPLFLFHYEPAKGVDDYALANRLSYFLWRSQPDEPLQQAAAAGRLSQPQELRKQAIRMLSDARSDRFLRDFVGQWLQINRVGEMQPDKGLYPEYDAELERAMVEETQLFIREMLVNDLPVSNLIDSDWTMLNDRLARHYGISGVTGNQFRKVKLDKKTTVRGGILTHASILSITSNGTTTSPVVRGVWVLDHLLGTPAPPPPPDVPPIEPDIRGATTIQDQLLKHRSISQCAECHQKIDPYGLALEQFDVIGGWRESYRALLPQKGRQRAQLGEGKPVIAADVLPRLGRYDGFVEFRKLLTRHEPLVQHNVTEKLAVYALGRRMSFSDRADLEQIVADARSQKGGLRTLVLNLVQSPLFRRP